jgi:hypothetical protein
MWNDLTRANKRAKMETISQECEDVERGMISLRSMREQRCETNSVISLRMGRYGMISLSSLRVRRRGIDFTRSLILERCGMISLRERRCGMDFKQTSKECKDMEWSH